MVAAVLKKTLQFALKVVSANLKWKNKTKIYLEPVIIFMHGKILIASYSAMNEQTRREKREL